jgi:adenylate cyclase
VIGDTVNTASRLQGLTRSLGTPLVVAEAIIAAIQAAPAPDATDLLSGFCEGGEKALRGRSAPVRIWTRAPS